MKSFIYAAWQWGEDLLRALGASEANPYNYEEWNIIVYGLIFPLLIATFVVLMSAYQIRIYRRDHNVVARRCEIWNLSMLVCCGLSALLLVFVCF